MNIGISMEEEKDDSELSEQFAVFCASKKKEFHDAGIRRITMVVFYKQQFPRYFTYRLVSDIYNDSPEFFLWLVIIDLYGSSTVDRFLCVSEFNVFFTFGKVSQVLCRNFTDRSVLLYV